MTINIQIMTFNFKKYKFHSSQFDLFLSKRDNFLVE